MSRAILALSILMLTACDAKAPPVKERNYLVRISYVTDVKVKPYASIDKCDVTRKFMAKELPDLDGYQLVVRCVPTGNVN
jgi:hypothetical protein